MEFLQNFKKEIFDLERVNDMATMNVRELIEDSENMYKIQIEKVANDIVLGGYKVVLLAGPSSSGKTTTSNLIRNLLRKKGFESIVVSLDDFFVNRVDTPKLANGDYDFENVISLDLDYLNTFTNDLFEKSMAYMPSFDFKTGIRDKIYKKICMTKNTIVIFEGIHALNPIVFKTHQDEMYKIYISVNSDYNLDKNVVIPAQKVRLMRRMLRDYNHRAMSISVTTKMWKNVLDGENTYIKPYKNNANFLINSSHAYEPLMYAKYLLPILEQDCESELAKETIAMLKKCQQISVDLLPNDSLLHEFLD